MYKSSKEDGEVGSEDSIEVEDHKIGCVSGTVWSSVINVPCDRELGRSSCWNDSFESLAFQFVVYGCCWSSALSL